MKLEFDAKTHTYSAEGRHVPGVTGVISPLEPFEGIPLHIKQQALERGTLVHKLTELWDDDAITNDMWLDIEEAGLEGYLIAWEAFKRDVVQEIVQSEQKVFSKKYWYAGTCDRVVRIKDRLAVLEIKTGGLVDAYGLQTAAYKAALNETVVCTCRNQSRPCTCFIDDRYVVVLKPDGTYTMAKHNDPTDFQTFIAALTIANWKASHK